MKSRHRGQSLILRLSLDPACLDQTLHTPDTDCNTLTMHT